MKKILLSLFIFGSVIALSSLSAQAQTGMMGGYYDSTATSTTAQPSTTQQVSQPITNSAIDSALQDIYKSQNVTSQDKVVCSKVTDTQYETLGDAYMGYGISEQQHTTMENMMGGEGSATVKQAHINMGRAYLGCWANYNSGSVVMPMMGSWLGSSVGSTTAIPAYGMMGSYYNNQNYPSMMNRSFGSGWNMMGGYSGGFSWGGLITMILVWVLLILGIAFLIRLFIKSNHQTK